MKATLQQEVAVAVLGGGAGTEPVEALFLKGLANYRNTRTELENCGLQSAVASLQATKYKRDYVRVALRRGVTVRISLASRDREWRRTIPLVTVVPATGAPRIYMDAGSGARELARRAGTDIEVVMRIVLGIERARRRLYELCEEATRWL